MVVRRGADECHEYPPNLSHFTGDAVLQGGVALRPARVHAAIKPVRMANFTNSVRECMFSLCMMRSR